MTIDERFPAFTGLGMYPYIYTDKDGEDLCTDCARKDYDEHGLIAHGTVYWEGRTILCAECGRNIESAYGEPDAEEAA